MNLARYIKIFGVARVLAAAAGWVALSTHGVSADIAVSGSFLATKDCPAFQSFRKATNPGAVKVEAGHSYALLAKNAPNATHYRVRIEGAAPPERWVGVNCGSSKEEAASGEATGTASNGRQAELVLSLGWEPGFCKSHDNKSECASETSDRFDADHFALHGLWPQPRRREYCNVSQEVIDRDKRGNWQELPNVDLAAETWARLSVVMPGTQSFLERHEWIRHGTCYAGGDAEA
jgi:ribonuclease T2